MSIAPSPAPAAPPQPPVAGAQAAQPPQGTSPATQSVPNRGTEVMAAQAVAQIVQLMGRAIGVAGGGSEIGLALADCIRKLAKFAPSGASNPTANADALRQLQQQQLAMQHMQQQAAQRPPGA